MVFFHFFFVFLRMATFQLAGHHVIGWVCGPFMVLKATPMWERWLFLGIILRYIDFLGSHCIIQKVLWNGRMAVYININYWNLWNINASILKNIFNHWDMAILLMDWDIILSFMKNRVLSFINGVTHFEKNEGKKGTIG